MHFWKYQGAGNDFVMVDQRSKKWIAKSDTDLIARLCDRHFGIGADGLILLQNHPSADFEMVYFNADGRESTMCGNGGRCIAAFAKDLGIERGQYRFLAIDGMHEAILSGSNASPDDWVELKMSEVDHIDPVDLQVETAAPGPAFVLNTGSPHYVRFVASTADLDMRMEGRAVRYAELFRLEGINVNLVHATPRGLSIRTYERGVEDETLACGTGVTAAALAWHLHSGGAAGLAVIPVKALGGDLAVRFYAHPNGVFTDIWLCGPAKRVFSGEIEF